MKRDGYYTEAECRYGNMRWITNDVGVGRCLELYREYSESEVALWRGLLGPEDVVISAGGNIGCHVIPLARIVAHVFTAEPNPIVADLLIRNCQVNDAQNVTLVPGAFSKERGKATIAKTDLAAATNVGGQSIGAAAGWSVPTMPIDDFDLPRCAMIHLDVEGHELPALLGAKNTIERCKPILYVECDRAEKNDRLLGWIRANGYQIAMHYGSAYNPENFAGNRDDIFGHTASIMALCIPDRKRK